MHINLKKETTSQMLRGNLLINYLKKIFIRKEKIINILITF